MYATCKENDLLFKNSVEKERLVMQILQKYFMTGKCINRFTFHVQCDIVVLEERKKRKIF